MLIIYSRHKRRDCFPIILTKKKKKTMDIFKGVDKIKCQGSICSDFITLSNRVN